MFNCTCWFRLSNIGKRHDIHFLFLANRHYKIMSELYLLDDCIIAWTYTFCLCPIPRNPFVFYDGSRKYFRCCTRRWILITIFSLPCDCLCSRYRTFWWYFSTLIIFSGLLCKGDILLPFTLRFWCVLLLSFKYSNALVTKFMGSRPSTHFYHWCS